MASIAETGMPPVSESPAARLIDRWIYVYMAASFLVITLVGFIPDSIMKVAAVKAGARAPSCFKVQKSSRTARSKRNGLSFPDRGRAIFPACAARAAFKATLEKDPTDGWIIGSNDVATIMDS